MESKIGQYLDNAIAKDTAPCWTATVVSKKGIKPVVSRGVATLDKKQPFDEKTLVWYASGSKLFIALAVLKLLDSGKVPGMTLETGLDDAETLLKFLPELKFDGDHPAAKLFGGWEGDIEDRKPILKQAKVPVTLRHLLTFTAGSMNGMFHPDIGALVTPTERNPTPFAVGSNECKAACLNLPRLAEAGSRDSYGYGGAGQELVGLFIARVTGQTQRQALYDLVMKPLGIARDDVEHYLSPQRKERLSDICAKTPDGWIKVPYWQAVWDWENGPPTDGDQEFGNAALCGTIGAYATLLQAVLSRSDKLLSARAWDLALADDLVHRSEQVKIPQPLWTDEAAPHATASVFMENDDVGTSLLQAMVERHETPSGCKEGTVHWAGLANLFWWVDVKQGIAGVISTQTFPFHSSEIMGVVRGYKRLVNDNISLLK